MNYYDLSSIDLDKLELSKQPRKGYSRRELRDILKTLGLKVRDEKEKLVERIQEELKKRDIVLSEKIIITPKPTPKSPIKSRSPLPIKPKPLPIKPKSPKHNTPKLYNKKVPDFSKPPGNLTP